MVRYVKIFAIKATKQRSNCTNSIEIKTGNTAYWDSFELVYLFVNVQTLENAINRRK